MKRFEAIPYKFYRNTKTGQEVSVFSSCPWVSDDDRQNWQIVTRGYHIRDNRLGITMRPGSLPLNCSAEAAQQWADEHNAKQKRA